MVSTEAGFDRPAPSASASAEPRPTVRRLDVVVAAAGYRRDIAQRVDRAERATPAQGESIGGGTEEESGGRRTPRAKRLQVGSPSLNEERVHDLHSSP